MPHVEHILALDVSWRELERAQQRLHVAEMPPRQRERLTLAQGSVLYHDPRLAGYDAAAVVEVIEHLDESRLVTFEQVVFARARPGVVLITTPTPTTTSSTTPWPPANSATSTTASSGPRRSLPGGPPA
ncbi:hypothetical protein MUN84_01675 [Hymenobacter sp. 5516J-16]|nr:hypothetical protein [Hymenobacter sp. 5516J-16]UOQ79056.1 hypothetical protein MUN84_01675 [Hymenobacter sp. 5516J-16]